jgi:hypothetical protein
MSLKIVVLWCLMPQIQQYFSYVVAVNFIGVENDRPVASYHFTFKPNN